MFILNRPFLMFTKGMGLSFILVQVLAFVGKMGSQRSVLLVIPDSHSA